MELSLKIDGKPKKIKNKEVTFKTFEKAIIYTKRMESNEFLGDNYPIEELTEAKEFICDYFDVTTEDFENGFIMRDGIDFFGLFSQVLMNIQTNEGRREVERDNEGK